MNPVNEKLRNDIPKAADMNDELTDILQKTNNIHVGFLFSGIGRQLLQKISLCLCASKDTLIYSGWKDLCIQIGLDPLLPKCLENYNIMNQDPVFTMIVSYTQMDDATVGKIYQALFDIKRFDVITQTRPNVYEFYNEICKTYDVPKQTEILKPYKIPTPPNIFQNFNKIESSDEIKKHQIKKSKEIKCRIQSTTKSNNTKCAKIVMLTYSVQDAITAGKIARDFREERSGQRIGVIMLQEQINKVCADREKLIVKFFAKADYIIPILSAEYLTTISERETYCSAFENMDSAYVKYIYDLMTNEYVSLGCRNKKIRCIIPDEIFSEVRKHYFFKNPVFRTWFQLSEIGDLAYKMLKNQI